MICQEEALLTKKLYDEKMPIEKIKEEIIKKFKSLRVVFPAACGEFVIPAVAGIQKTGLDSASSAE